MKSVLNELLFAAAVKLRIDKAWIRAAKPITASVRWLGLGHGPT